MVPSARLGFGVKQLSGSGSSPWLGHLPGRSLPRAIRSERPALRLAPTTASDGGNTVCRSANAERGPTVHPALSPDGDTAGVVSGLCGRAARQVPRVPRRALLSRALRAQASWTP